MKMVLSIHSTPPAIRVLAWHNLFVCCLLVCVVIVPWCAVPSIMGSYVVLYMSLESSGGCKQSLTPKRGRLWAFMGYTLQRYHLLLAPHRPVDYMLLYTSHVVRKRFLPRKRPASRRVNGIDALHVPMVVCGYPHPLYRRFGLHNIVQYVYHSNS